MVPRTPFISLWIDFCEESDSFFPPFFPKFLWTSNSYWVLLQDFTIEPGLFPGWQAGRPVGERRLTACIRRAHSCTVLLPMQCATVSRQGGANNKIQGSREQGHWKLHGRKPSLCPTAFPRALSQDVTIALE